MMTTTHPPEAGLTLHSLLLDPTEGAENAILLLSNPSGNASLGAPSQVTLTIVDDEAPVRSFLAAMIDGQNGFESFRRDSPLWGFGRVGATMGNEKSIKELE